MESFKEVIALWPSRSELAEDSHADLAAVHKWVERDSIPAEYWWIVSRAAKRRRLPVTAQKLAYIAHRKRRSIAG